MITIRYGGMSPEETLGSRALYLTLHDADQQQLAQVEVVSSPQATELLRIETGDIAGEMAVPQALARYGVRRLEAILADPVGRDALLDAGQRSLGSGR